MKDKHTAIVKSIEQLLTRQEQVVVAIDGCTASGTDFLAGLLADVFDGNVFRASDYYMREMTNEGHYLDRERFRREVLEPVKKGVPFFFRPIGNCLMEAVEPRRLNIIEGTFSLHREIRDMYDLKIMLRTDTAQKKRFINEMEPKMRLYYEAQRFPAEARYFRFTEWESLCDFVVDTKEIEK